MSQNHARVLVAPLLLLAACSGSEPSPVAGDAATHPADAGGTPLTDPLLQEDAASAPDAQPGLPGVVDAAADSAGPLRIGGIMDILTRSCAMRDCHGTLSPADNLSLASANIAYRYLVNKQPDGAHTSKYAPLDALPADNDCTVPYDNTKLIRVIPYCPEGSFLYQKITDTHKTLAPKPDDDNTVMPRPSSGLTLTEAEKNLIKRWIAEGAQP